MAETSKPEKRSPLTVSGVVRRLKRLLDPALAAPVFWLQGEVSSLTRASSGATYFDLIETKGTRVIAKLRCHLWGDDHRRIRSKRGAADIETALRNGSKIGVHAKVRMHDVYGLSLQVYDLDPHVTLGALEAKRLRIIERLRAASLLEGNARRAVPLLPQRVGLVASAQTAGYADFVETVLSAGYGISLIHADARVQGDDAERSLLRALGRLERLGVELIVLIRGGGSRLDLAALDSEAVARRIAGLAIPVWTGIGHETDRSVLDLVAAESFKTPTAAGEALVSRFAALDERLHGARERLRSRVEQRLAPQRERLQQGLRRLRYAPVRALRTVHERLDHDQLALQRLGSARLATERRELRRRRELLGPLGSARVRLELQAVSTHAKSLHKTASRRVLAAQRTTRALAQRLTGAVVPGRIQVERERLSTHDKSLRKTSTRRLLGERRLNDERRRGLRPKLALRPLELRKSLLERASLELARSAQQALSPRHAQLGSAQSRLRVAAQRLHLARSRLVDLREALRRAASRELERRDTQLERQSELLRSVDPQRVLERGFALIYGETGVLARSTAALPPGSRATLRLADGVRAATIDETRADDEERDNDQ